MMEDKTQQLHTVNPLMIHVLLLTTPDEVSCHIVTSTIICQCSPACLKYVVEGGMMEYVSVLS